MPLDKLDDHLSWLSLKDREILEKLAELNLRTPEDEIRSLIRGRAFGRYKDLGDDRVNPQVYEADLSEFLIVKSLRVEKVVERSRDNDPKGRTPQSL